MYRRLMPGFFCLLGAVIMSGCGDDINTPFDDKPHIQTMKLDDCFVEHATRVQRLLRLEITGPGIDSIKGRVTMYAQYMWEGVPHHEYQLKLYETGTVGSRLVLTDTLLAQPYLGHTRCDPGDCVPLHYIDCN